MNKIYRTVIIDDEESAIDNLCLALKPYGQIVVEGVAHNGAAGLKLIEKVRPDLVFQDVELPDMLGMELVTRARKKLGVNMEVVFYTAYNKYMIDAFRSYAFDFLLKPIDDGELDTIMNRFYADSLNGNGSARQDDTLKREDGKLLFYTNAVDFRLIQIRDICVFHYDHEARVWTVIAAGCDRPLRLKRNITKENLLKIDDSFIQVGQKYIININYLLEVRDNICCFYPPFDKIDYVKVGRFFRRKLISRYNSL